MIAARSVLTQEFGRDPVLLQRMKDLFREKALMNCVATEKGKAKIDEFHRYYVSDSTVDATALCILNLVPLALQIPSRSSCASIVVQCLVYPDAGCRS
jgi:transcriptional accessory protein Tex/SPT6